MPKTEVKPRINVGVRQAREMQRLDYMCSDNGWHGTQVSLYPHNVGVSRNKSSGVCVYSGHVAIVGCSAKYQCEENTVCLHLRDGIAYIATIRKKKVLFGVF